MSGLPAISQSVRVNRPLCAIDRSLGGLNPRLGLSASLRSPLSPQAQPQQQVMRTRPRLSRCTNMAARARRNVAIVACILCVFFGQLPSVEGKTFPSIRKVKEWATGLGNNLERVLSTLTGWHVMNNDFNAGNNLGDVEFRAVEPGRLVERMATTLSKMLSKKMDALWLLVKAAEDEARNYTYNPQLKKGNVFYYDSKNMGDTELMMDSRFNQRVNFNFSSVHIPVEIYHGDTSILNGLQWTAALDDQFRKNYKEDDEILWQFFGSQSGFMRTYPASNWNTHGQVDLFDVRRQSWYTQGSSSPKDMMILIDTSGSTHGQALQLMKNAVKSILDTLGENDFVNIVEFNQEAKFVSSCFNHTAFVQANYRNKKQLEKDVDALKATGQADYQEGLRFAFQRFREFTENRTDNGQNVGANCNKVIILLTDGGTDSAEEVFKQYNWPNKTVRVFTYAVGPTATPVAAIKWMACANRGYFSQIPAMGAIRARVQDYLEVMGRPLALSHVEHTQWTSSHKTPLTDDLLEHTHYLKQGMEQLNVQPHQWEITVESRGLGMMTTVTLPVYNRALGSSNQTILGVMGIDVPTTQLGSHTPYMEIGPVGYSFAINPNGYAVFHPNLKRTGRYMKDPPNIDLLELELEQSEEDDAQSQLVELRNQMIEGGKSYVDISDALFLSPDKKYVTPMRANYSFTNITNTTFRLGLCVPEFQRKYPHFRSTSLPDIDFDPDISDSWAFLIAPWQYFGKSAAQQEVNSTLSSLVAALRSGAINTANLTMEQLQTLHLLNVGVKVAKQLLGYFNVISPEHTGNEFSRDAIKLHFMAMNGGLTIVYPRDQASLLADDLDVHNSTYYKRSMYTHDFVLTPDIETFNGTHLTITASRSISVNPDKYRIAVAGVKLGAEELRNFTLKALRNSSKFDTQSLMTCDDVDDVMCYIVDDGGFLLASNQDNDTYMPGKFLGELDPQVWNMLFNNKVFGRAVQHDFQALCKVQKDETSAGHRSFLVPSVSMLFETLTTSWWTSKVTWAYTSFNVYNWLFGESAVYAEDEGESSDDDEEEECVLATQQFYLKKEFANFTNTITCAEGSRRVVSHMVPLTNLLMIMAEPSCVNSDLDMPVVHKPYKISEKEEQELVCMLSRHPRKRVLSYGCYDNDPNEDDTKCGASALPASRLTALTAASVTVTTVWLLLTHLR